MGWTLIRMSWTEFFFSHKWVELDKNVLDRNFFSHNWVGPDKLSWMEFFFFSNAKCLGLISEIEE